MSKNITLYKLLISCPGDITEEIAIIKEAIDQFNELYSEVLCINIQPKHWVKSAYAQSGGKPQALLNEQFVKDCDAAVAIFGNRFGSPTDKYGSGTEEEIEIMLKANKQVFMYFSDKPQKPSEHNPAEYERIQAFREKYKEKGIYYTYSSNDDFKAMFFAHLSMYFLSEKRMSDVSSKHLPLLELCSISKDGKICENLCTEQFAFNSEYTTATYLDIIKEMIDTINNIIIEQPEKNNDAIFLTSNEEKSIKMSSFMYESVKIGEDVKSIIIDVADYLKINLSDDFFDLGDLCQSIVPTDGIEGTENEIKKYRLIISLYSTINDLLNWEPVERAFANIKCIKLVLVNKGTAIDEDVEVSVTIPKESLMRCRDFPELKYEDMEYLSQDCDLDILFGIRETAVYQKYTFPEVSEPYIPETPVPFFYSSPDYSESYINALKDVFCYKCFDENDNYILKISFKYIKHNTAIAFPTPLLLKNDVAKINYSITSKNNPQINNGTLEK